MTCLSLESGDHKHDLTLPTTSQSRLSDGDIFELSGCHNDDTQRGTNNDSGNDNAKNDVAGNESIHTCNPWGPPFGSSPGSPREEQVGARARRLRLPSTKLVDDEDFLACSLSRPCLHHLCNVDCDCVMCMYESHLSCSSPSCLLSCFPVFGLPRSCLSSCLSSHEGFPRAPQGSPGNLEDNIPFSYIFSGDSFFISSSWCLHSTSSSRIRSVGCMGFGILSLQGSPGLPRTQKTIPGSVTTALKDVSDVDIQATDRHQAKGDLNYTGLVKLQADNLRTAKRRYHRTRSSDDESCLMRGAATEDHDHYWGCPVARRVRHQTCYRDIRRILWTTIPPILRQNGIAPALASRIKGSWWEGPSDDTGPRRHQRWEGIKDQRHDILKDYLQGKGYID